MLIEILKNAHDTEEFDRLCQTSKRMNAICKKYEAQILPHVPVMDTETAIKRVQDWISNKYISNPWQLNWDGKREIEHIMKTFGEQEPPVKTSKNYYGNHAKYKDLWLKLPGFVHNRNSHLLGDMRNFNSHHVIQNGNILPREERWQGPKYSHKDLPGPIRTIFERREITIPNYHRAINATIRSVVESVADPSRYKKNLKAKKKRKEEKRRNGQSSSHSSEGMSNVPVSPLTPPPFPPQWFPPLREGSPRPASHSSRRSRSRRRSRLRISSRSRTRSRSSTPPGRVRVV